MGGRAIILVVAIIVGAGAIYFSIQTLTDMPTVAPPEETDSPIGAGEKASVRMSGIEFLPGDVSVRTGQPIEWVNEDQTEHTVTKVSGPGPDFDSAELGPGERFEQKVEDRGVVEYMCTIHPEDMQGAFKVVGG